MTNGEKAWQNKTNGLDQLHYLSDSLTVLLYNMVFFICDSFGKGKWQREQGPTFLWHQRAADFIPAWAAEVVVQVWNFLKVLCALKNKHWIRRANFGFGVEIQYSDALESVLGFPTSNYQADWHLQASTGRLFTHQPPFFVLYIYGQVLSGDRKHNGTWKPL